MPFLPDTIIDTANSNQYRREPQLELEYISSDESSEESDFSLDEEDIDEEDDDMKETMNYVNIGSSADGITFEICADYIYLHDIRYYPSRSHDPNTYTYYITIEFLRETDAHFHSFTFGKFETAVMKEITIYRTETPFGRRILTEPPIIINNTIVHHYVDTTPPITADEHFLYYHLQDYGEVKEA